MRPPPSPLLLLLHLLPLTPPPPRLAVHRPVRSETEFQSDDALDGTAVDPRASDRAPPRGCESGSRIFSARTLARYERDRPEGSPLSDPGPVRDDGLSRRRASRLKSRRCPARERTIYAFNSGRRFLFRAIATLLLTADRIFSPFNFIPSAKSSLSLSLCLSATPFPPFAFPFIFLSL